MLKFGYSLFLFVFVVHLPMLHAEEVISRYQSDITVEANGTVDVIETINVISEGQNIKHGIYRYFPLMFEIGNGEKEKAGFELLDVKRDGQDETHHTEADTDGIRIYAGSKDSEVQPGPHVYTFHYRTDRQIRYFSDHDELYWNVTGNGWKFPILEAIAKVHMPADIPTNGVKFYTGSLGSRANQATLTTLSSGHAEISSNVRLEPGEGLTIDIIQPKGAIYQPSASLDKANTRSILAAYFQQYAISTLCNEADITFSRNDISNIKTGITELLKSKGLEQDQAVISDWDAISRQITANKALLSPGDCTQAYQWFTYSLPNIQIGTSTPFPFK